MSIESPPADKRILNLHEGFVNVVAALVAYAQPPGVLLPAERTLRYPAETPQPFTALNPTPGNACHDPTLAQAASQLLVVICFVRMNLLRAMTRPAPLTAHKWDCVDSRKHLLSIGHVRPRKQRRQRQTVLVYYLMALGSRTPSVHRRRADRRTDRPPFFAPLARMKIESTLARLQSRRWAASSFASISSWSVCQTLALCQSRRRRQQVMPLPQPISWGSISQGMPLLRTNRMPVKATRSARGGLPRVPGWQRWGGNSGSTSAQSSSETSCLAMLGVYPIWHFC